MNEMVREFGISMYTLLYLKCITNKDLLPSTGTSAQSYVQPGWERSLRENVCMYMAEYLYCLPETITTLLIGYVCVSLSVMSNSL